MRMYQVARAVEQAEERQQQVHTSPGCARGWAHVGGGRGKGCGYIGSCYPTALY